MPLSLVSTAGSRASCSPCRFPKPRVLLVFSMVKERQQTGTPLIAGDLGPANRVVRGLIGEPFATQLDAGVGQTVAAQAIQASMEQLMQFGGGLNFGLGNLGGMQSAINMRDIEHQVDVQLGGMGIF